MVASALIDLMDAHARGERESGMGAYIERMSSSMLRFLTAGESHGPQLTVIVEGVPAGLPLTSEGIDAHMRRRQLGHGRSERQKMERDHAEIVGGVRGGLTLGSPVALVIANRVWDHWQDRMRIEPGDTGEKVTAVRPGHADLAGALKYGHDDVRNILERSSARETAARVAVGAVARALLRQLDITIHSHTVSMGAVVGIGPARRAADTSCDRRRCRVRALLARAGGVAGALCRRRCLGGDGRGDRRGQARGRHARRDQ